jgi:hypothetical protein
MADKYARNYARFETLLAKARQERWWLQQDNDADDFATVRLNTSVRQWATNEEQRIVKFVWGDCNKYEMKSLHALNAFLSFVRFGGKRPQLRHLEAACMTFLELSCSERGSVYERLDRVQPVRLANIFEQLRADGNCQNHGICLSVDEMKESLSLEEQAMMDALHKAVDTKSLA